MATQNENDGMVSPSVGSKEVAEDRQKTMKMRQYAYAELCKQKEPEVVIEELVSMGMERDQASKLVYGFFKRNEESSATNMYEEQEVTKSSNSKTTIILGIAMIVIGIVIPLVTFMSAAESGGSVVITYGLVIAGIGVLVKGLASKN